MNAAILNRYLPESVRAYLEQSYYAKVNEQARLENMILDPEFWQSTDRHPGLFSDHGVVHVRDIALQVLWVLETINGTLIPHRTQDQLESFMNAYGVMLAYLHDIGMSDFSQFGRAMHPEYAAQAVFREGMDEVIDSIWEWNPGGIADHLTKLYQRGIFSRDPHVILRELLSLSVGHSKSKIPVLLFDDPARFRDHMKRILRHNLHDLYRAQQVARDNPVGTNQLNGGCVPQYLDRFYSDFEGEAFDWMVAGSEEARSLFRDVTDALRALRCADALRQRGTVQKTSGGYEVFVSPQSGNALYALRLGDERLYLVEFADQPISVGEANMAGIEFTKGGNLRISFQRGAYESEDALHRSAYSTAFVINDILYDIVDSFQRKTPIPTLKAPHEIQVLLESSDDNPSFTGLVKDKLGGLNPQIRAQIQVVPSLQNVSELERARYLKANDLDWDSEKRLSFLERMAQAGQKLSKFDPVEGFKHVKITSLGAGETLLEAGAPSAFVYVPLGDGLRIMPLGGYRSFSVAAWMPLGNTGVIRGDIRNADVIASEDVSLLMIPKQVYMRYWYAPYSFQEFKVLHGAGTGDSISAGSMSNTDAALLTAMESRPTRLPDSYNIPP